MDVMAVNAAWAVVDTCAVIATSATSQEQHPHELVGRPVCWFDELEPLPWPDPCELPVGVPDPCLGAPGVPGVPGE
jgi:hypothetical protein